jgi:hypothetical protein
LRQPEQPGKAGTKGSGAFTMGRMERGAIAGVGGEFDHSGPLSDQFSWTDLYMRPSNKTHKRDFTARQLSFIELICRIACPL